MMMVGTGNAGEHRRSTIKFCTATLVIVFFLMTDITGFRSGRMAGNEVAAVRALHTIHRAQLAYAAECGHGHYATSLMDLATSPPGKNEAYLPYELGRMPTPQLQGYLFNIRPATAPAGPNDCNDFPTQTGYYVVAVPIRLGETGRRSFASNEQGDVWGADGLPPPSEPFGAPSARVD